MSIDKTYLVAGGDMRQLYLAKTLAKQGNRVYIACFEEASELSRQLVPVDLQIGFEQPVDCIVLPLPVTNDGVYLNTPLSHKQVLLEDVLKAAGHKTVVFGGKLDESIYQLCREKGIAAVDYLKREEMAVLNAVPTAEGALELLIQELPTTLFGTRCLVTGMGRISKVLIRYLTALHADVTVAARKCSDLAWAKVFGCRGIHTSRIAEHAGEFDCVVNTVPAKLFDYSVLSRLDEHCVILDLASKPGGVDFELARQLGVKAVWALSLPGKVAPVTSGEIICSTIQNILAERGED